MRICYLNGEFIQEDQAAISIFDRGFLFADGVYEVSLVLNGQLIDNQGHLKRLSRSLQTLDITAPLSSEEIIHIQQQLIEKNQLDNGGIYLQITRGSDGDRDFLPSNNMTPTVTLFPQHKDIINNPLAQSGASIMSYPDIRWLRCDIKSVGLLGAVLGKKTAEANGYDDAWFVKDGYVTEGTASNAYIIKDNNIITKPPSEEILAGITRQSIKRLAEENGLSFVERSFTLEEAKQADEAFNTSATLLVVPVTHIDGQAINGGNPGELTQKLRHIYIETALGNCLP